MPPFVHLHLHTKYSLLDGACNMPDLMAQAQSLGQQAIAITDHGVMYGVIEFYKAAKKQGIKPILGCEVYTAARTRHDKVNESDSSSGHLVLLAENMTGYKNLMHIVSIGFIEGFYYKPRIDFEVLEQYHEGLICLSACLGGDVQQAIRQGNYENAKALATRYQNIFGEGNYFLELQDHGIEEQKPVNAGIIRLHRDLGIPMVATNDVHYVKKHDAKAQDVLLCIQTAKKLEDTDRMQFETHEFYLKSGDEMLSLFPNHPEAIQNTVEIANRCNVELRFGELHLPQFDVPVGTTPLTYLKSLCLEGLQKRYPQNASEQMERLDFELDIIAHMGFVDYFLIVWDFIRFAKEQDIAVGPGRGSAAGSIVSYCLGITNVDPIRFGLLFERFLNPERVSMPDIDIDFCYERRQEVIDYVVAKYGADCVAQIITFGTMAARAAIRDVGRVLNVPYADVDAIAKKVPMGIGMNLDTALKISTELSDQYKNDVQTKELIDMALALEGMPRHASTHAAGVVISKEPLSNYVPLQKNDEVVTTQFTMTTLEELGLLKMDFLGLRTLTVIRDTLAFIKEYKNITVDLDAEGFEHSAVYDLLCQGNTEGVFQLESAGMKQFMRDLKPRTIEDIIAGISLYRPGPMDSIPRYVENKNHPEKITFLHEKLSKILDVTYGCIVYQEQVMQIVRELAGYSYGRADMVRRAMSKKKADVMEREAKNFVYGIKDEKGEVVVEGCIARGVPEAAGKEIFDEMMDFAKYAFNKSHAAAYAVIAYHTAYLKTYYPTEFMAAMLNSSDKIPQYIAECRKMGIAILPPDVNESTDRFTPMEQAIRFGLVGIKNVGVKMVRLLVEEREKHGKFKSFEDFCERMSNKDMNKRAVESMIKAGVFDCFAKYRSQLMYIFEGLLDGIASQKKQNVEGQMSLFGESMGATDALPSSSVTYPALEEFQHKELLMMEKEMLGLYISGHPLDQYVEALQKSSSIGIGEIWENHELLRAGGIPTVADNTRLNLGGIIAHRKNKTTKNDAVMAFITLEDLTGNIEVIVFPKTLTKYSNLLQEDNLVMVKGRLSLSEDEDPKIICEDVSTFSAPQITKKLYLKLSTQDEELLAQVMDILSKHQGGMPVYLYDAQTKAVNLADRKLWVKQDTPLLEQLFALLGIQNVKIVEG